MSGSARILVGVVGAAHGIRGELRLKSFTGDPMAIASYGPLQTEDGRRSFKVAAARLLKGDMLVVRFEGVGDRSAAEPLTNTRLYVDRSTLPAPDPEEFYHADLIGLRVETETGVAVGHVVAMQNYGAGDLLEVAPPSGDSLLVPFSTAFVPVVDLASGRVVVTDTAVEAATDDDEG